MTCGQIDDSISWFFFPVIAWHLFPSVASMGLWRIHSIPLWSTWEITLLKNAPVSAPGTLRGRWDRTRGLWDIFWRFGCVIGGSDARREKSRVPDHWCSWCERSVQWGLFTRSQNERPAWEAAGMWVLSPGRRPSLGTWTSRQSVHPGLNLYASSGSRPLLTLHFCSK